MDSLRGRVSASLQPIDLALLPRENKLAEDSATENIAKVLIIFCMTYIVARHIHFTGMLTFATKIRHQEAPGYDKDPVLCTSVNFGVGLIFLNHEFAGKIPDVPLFCRRKLTILRHHQLVHRRIQAWMLELCQDHQGNS